MTLSLRPNESPPDVWDRLLGKYVIVWLWSILFGSTTALGTGLAYLSFSSGRWGPLVPPLLITALSGVAFVVNAWWSLYLFLVRVLLPQFFGGRPVEIHPSSGRYLSRAFQSMFIASVIGMITLIMKFAVEALR